MDVSLINSNVLRKLLSLSEKKEVLLKQVAEIEKEIAGFTFGGSSAPAPKAKPGRKPSAVKVAGVKAPKARKARGGKRGKRGALKEQILAVLGAAGDAGARVKDIADKLRINPQNIHVWFSSTGKKIATIKRVDAGHYKLASAKPAVEAKPAAAPQPAPAKPVAPAAKSAAKSAKKAPVAKAKAK